MTDDRKEQAMSKIAWPIGMQPVKPYYEHTLMREAETASLVAELDSKIGTMFTCNRCGGYIPTPLSFNSQSHCYRLGTFFFSANEVGRIRGDDIFFYD